MPGVTNTECFIICMKRLTALRQALEECQKGGFYHVVAIDFGEEILLPTDDLQKVIEKEIGKIEEQADYFDRRVMHGKD